MGGSSSQVVGYRYYAKFAAFIGNRIEKFIGINFDNRKWIIKDKDDTASYLEVKESNLFGENEGGVSGNVDIHFGYPNQEPNAEYQKYLPLVSGYPYQSYLVFRGLVATNPFTGSQTTAPGFYLGNSGYMKEMLLWVKRTRVRNDGQVQWYVEKSEIGGFDAAIDNPVDLNTDGHLNGVSVGTNQQRKYWSHANSGWVTTAFGDVSGVISVGGLKGFPNNSDIQYNTVFNKGWSRTTFHHDGRLNGLAVISGNITVSSDWKSKFGVPRIVPLTQADPPTKDHNLSKHVYRYSQWLNSSDPSGLSYFYKFYFDFSKSNSAGFGMCWNTEDFENKGYQTGFRIFANTLIVGPTTDIDAIDINPIHKIREILTDDTAMGKPEADINDLNFRKAADRIWNEGLGVSWVIDEKSCIEAIEELCYHIEAGIRVNRQTGLYEMVLFRDDWFSEEEIHTIAENKIKDLSLEVMNSDDIVNQLNVTYYDRQRIKNSTFSIYENGSILTMGHANAESVEFPYFMNMRNAEIVANWKLKQFSTPAWSGSFSTGWREARKWNRYDLIRLPWSKKWNGTILARIMKINLGNGTDNTVTIDFEEVIPYSGEMNTSIVVDAPINAAPQPPQPSMNAVFEAPYYLTVLRAGQTNVDLELSNNSDIGYVAAIAAKPQNNSLNALLFTDGGVGEFEQVSRLDYCDILQLDQPITETTSSFVVTGSLTQTANSNNLILLNDELIGFVSFDDATKVLTVKRGVLDTVPKKHSSGSLFVFDLPDVAFDSTQYAQNEIVEAQVLTTTPSGIQELLETGQAIEIQSRAIRPYPPANVKINGEYWPTEIETDLIITWVDRNRVQQTGGTPLSWFDNGVAIEPGTQTHLILTQLDGNQIELATSNANVTGATSYTMPISSMQADTRFVKAILKTVRDGYECLQPFEYTVELSQFFSAPYDLTVEFKND